MNALYLYIISLWIIVFLYVSRPRAGGARSADDASVTRHADEGPSLRVSVLPSVGLENSFGVLGKTLEEDSEVL